MPFCISTFFFKKKHIYHELGSKIGESLVSDFRVWQKMQVIIDWALTALKPYTQYHDMTECRDLQHASHKMLLRGLLKLFNMSANMIEVFSPQSFLCNSCDRQSSFQGIIDKFCVDLCLPFVCLYSLIRR